MTNGASQGHSEEGTGRVLYDPWFITNTDGRMVALDEVFWWQTQAAAIEAAKDLAARSTAHASTFYVNRQFGCVSRVVTYEDFKEE